jgi:hypothetical protein
MASGDITGYTYNRVVTTQPSSGFTAWFGGLTAGAQVKIIHYEEFQSIDPNAKTPNPNPTIKVKLVTETARIQP